MFLFGQSRRHLLPGLLLLVAILALPSKASADPRERLVAVIMTGNLERYQAGHEAFLQILRAGGLNEKKVQIYTQTPNPDAASLANSVRKAVGVGADLIVAYGAPAALAAQHEARDIPILFADVYDPERLGVFHHEGRVRKKVTGVSGRTPIETLVKVSREIYPFKCLGVLAGADDPTSALQLRELEGLAAQMGFQLIRKEVRSAAGIGPAVTELAGRADTLYLAESPLLQTKLAEIMAAASAGGLTVVSQIPGLADRGGLLSLEADPKEQGQLLGVHALQLLSGQTPDNLPLRTPKRVSLVVNLRVAQQMRMTVPFQTLTMATRVIK